jgi:hypothetical protein
MNAWVRKWPGDGQIKVLVEVDLRCGFPVELASPEAGPLTREV